jgi:acyl-[acyl-carrier-protein]-phospholipid O-acyltransferase/long-chain-fatty-acid--[acyl-carrier-protein] ligase
MILYGKIKMNNINQMRLLITRRFLPLFITQFFGAFNDNVFKNALVILIAYRIVSSISLSQILVTIAAGIFILPFFLFSATAGQLADKYEKSQLIVVIKFAEIILMLLATLSFYFQNVPMLFLVLFLLGVQATFFGPLKYSILPNLLNKNELLAGNGLIEAGTFVSILLGTIFGGVLVLLPFGEYLISMAICLIAIFGFLSSLSIPKTTIQNLNLVINYNFFTETIRLIQYSKTRSDIFLSIMGISWFWFIGAVYLAEFPVFTKDILHADQYVVTLFIALFTIGIAIGSLLCNQLLKGTVSPKYVPLTLFGITIFTIDLYFASYQMNTILIDHLLNPIQFLSTFNGIHIAIDLLIISVCGGLYTVPLYALLQQKSDEAYRARVIASNNIINAIFMVLASIFTALILMMHFTVLDVFFIVGIVNLFFIFYIRKLSFD